jgi:hypothetical protein
LPEEYRDAYFQLILHPVKASANLQEMYTEQAKNINLYQQNNIEANIHARKVMQLFRNDSVITNEYHLIRDGKWNHMMDQTHIGYTYWQQPPVQRMPSVFFVQNYNATAPAEKSVTENISSKNLIPSFSGKNMFYELNGVVSIEAAHFSKAVNADGIVWKVLPDHGKTGDAVTTFPVTSADIALTEKSACLEYEFYTYSSGPARVTFFCSPTLNFHNDGGLVFAVSLDDEAPVIINLNRDDNNVQIWEKWVAANILAKTSEHNLTSAGKHTLKYWMMNPGIVLQKIVIDLGGIKQSYLGPPETRYLMNKK